MIRILGLRGNIFKLISKNYDQYLAYENDELNCVEFYSNVEIRSFPDHIEIILNENESITFSRCDFWRIEIE